MARPKLIALASGGGHWVQLQRLRPAFEEFETVYVSMFESYAEQVAGSRYYVVPDASRFDLRSFAPVFWRALKIMLRERPRAVVTTRIGADARLHLAGPTDGLPDAVDRQHRQLRADVVVRPSGQAARPPRYFPSGPEVVAAREGVVECWGAIL